jgi:hypothetical protein
MKTAHVEANSIARTGTNSAPKPNGHVVSISSPAIARAVVAELLLKPNMLSAAMKKALANSDGSDRTLSAALERMTIWADLTSLVVHGLNAEETQWREAALRYCIIRQAHYALLKKLFKVSRDEVARIRQELGNSVETRPKGIPDAALSEIYQAWSEICNEFDQREADRWVCIAERFPQFGLNSLYHVIVNEGCHSKEGVQS